MAGETIPANTIVGLFSQFLTRSLVSCITLQYKVLVIGLFMGVSFMDNLLYKKTQHVT